MRSKNTCWDCGKTVPPDQMGPKAFQCARCFIEVPLRKARERQEAIRVTRQRKAGQIHRAIDTIIPLAYQRARMAGLSRDLRNELAKVGDSWVYLWGAPGTGKTHALYALCRHRIASGHSVIFSRWTAMADTLRDAARVNQGITRMLDEYGRADVVVIDDILGGDTETDFARQRLLEIVDCRLDHGRPIWFSSNRPVEHLKETFDDRLFSRVAGYCRILKLPGRDRRLNPDPATSPTTAAGHNPTPSIGAAAERKPTARPGGLFK